MTKVINIKDAPSDWKENKDYVYIGRSGHGQDGYFGNPFKLERGEPRGITLEKYKEYFYFRLKIDDEFSARIQQLRGKILLCFCEPNPCHGDIIVEYLESELKWKKI